jgi:hypothetical protein
VHEGKETRINISDPKMWGKLGGTGVHNIETHFAKVQTNLTD